MELLQELVSDYTLRTVALGAMVLGIVSGSLGTYAVLRGQSLLGDAVSHAALPGIAIAFLVTGTRHPLPIMLGAAIAGLLATAAVLGVVRTSRVKYDSALGLALSVFFGFGLVLLTFIQRLPAGNQAGLDAYLFGQAAALVARDVWSMAILGATAIAFVLLLWKEFKMLAFDPEFGRAAGFPMTRLDLGLTLLLVVAIVIGLQTVGVVLMSAMLVAPAAAARQWTDRLGVMMIVAALFGSASGVSGAVLSSMTRNLPTGPTIVLCASFIVVVSLLFAPNRGLLWRVLRERRRSRQLRAESVLLDLFELSRQHPAMDHPHDEASLSVMSHRANVRFALRRLAQSGAVRQTSETEWALTTEGVRRARLLAERSSSGQIDPPLKP